MSTTHMSKPSVETATHGQLYDDEGGHTVSNTHENDSDSHSSSDNDSTSSMESLSLSAMLHSASTFHAIAFPVSITMTLAALAAVFINTDVTISQGAQQFSDAYTVWDVSGNSGTGQKLVLSIANTFVIVCVIALITFFIVFLYRQRCMKCLMGYMVFSSATLLGFLGHTMASLFIEIYHTPMDVITYSLGLYNFAVVGILAIFFPQQVGIPMYITQLYLVCTSVILAWNLSHFDDWTAWTLLVMLALYDLCAVLTPCGPLKALVNSMQEKDSPEMPGLLYEAHVDVPGQGIQKSTSQRTKERLNNRSRSNVSNVPTSEQKEEPTSSQSHTQPKAPSTVMIPLAIARIYKFPLVSLHDYGTSTSSRQMITLQSQSVKPTELPLLEDYPNAHITPDSFYEGKFTAKELRSDVRARLPYTGCRIEKYKQQKYVYGVYNATGTLKRVLRIDKRGKVFQVVDREDDDGSSCSENDRPSSIRLGLGDFIFYSVLVAKAALHSFTTFAACVLSILTGLGGTLILLSVYRSALPALPISIFMGVVVYILVCLLMEPMVQDIMTAPFYV